MLNKKAPPMPELDAAAASAIMENIFIACEREPTTIPLDVLASYTQYRRDRYSLQKGILIFILIVFLLLPVCFISPKFEVSQISSTATGAPTLEVRVQNFIPVRLVSARLNDHTVAVYESEASVFTVEPAANGHLTLTVTLLNRQYDIWETDIDTIDAAAPKLAGSNLENGKLSIYVEDEGVGTDLENAYAVSVDGRTVEPSGFDNELGCVEFQFERDLNIFIPDRNGNILQLVLTVKEENKTE